MHAEGDREHVTWRLHSTCSDEWVSILEGRGLGRGGIISGFRDDVNEIALINLVVRERQGEREKQSAFRLLIWDRKHTSISVEKWKTILVKLTTVV